MLALAGYPLDLDFVFLDPATEACAAPLGDHLHAEYTDESALARFCETCEVATYEFENVPGSVADFVAARRPMYPPPRALTAGQDRLGEKRLFDQLSIPVPKYLPVATRDALDFAVGAIGLPSILKTRRMGYDGKGQVFLREPADLDRAWEQLSGQALILERFVEFEREVSCIAARGRDGSMAFYPLVENVHRDGILRVSMPRRDDPYQVQAENHVRAVAEHLQYVGVMAFEFFVAGDRLLANEIAPRVHNSGHWTIEGAECSQFENHLRAIAGLPLGAVGLRGESVMFNFVGQSPSNEKLTAIPGVHVHHYGKTPKPLRKVGHATVTAEDPETLRERRRLIEGLIAT